MDPLLEALWNEMPEIQASDSLQRLRRTIHADLASAAGPDLADNLWASSTRPWTRGSAKPSGRALGPRCACCWLCSPE